METSTIRDIFTCFSPSMDFFSISSGHGLVKFFAWNSYTLHRANAEGDSLPLHKILYQADVKTEIKSNVMSYTCEKAELSSYQYIFYIIGHLWSPVFDFPANKISEIDQLVGNGKVGSPLYENVLYSFASAWHLHGLNFSIENKDKPCSQSIYYTSNADLWVW
uniref:Uncharacterized protein n=1 Tax=Solanum lycopersicum TaxID=4081 RepID=A0A3Q7EFG1_SOLLC